MSTVVKSPDIPFYGLISGGLRPGLTVVIMGNLPYGARRFAVNFMVGDTIDAAVVENNDIAFHFNPRLDEKKVVRNSRNSNEWDREEEIHSMPFAAGGGFELIFLIHPEYFIVMVNGAHRMEFKHRMPIHLVKILNITGDVTVDKIEYQDELKYPGETGLKSTYGEAGLPTPVYNPPIPMVHPLTGGLKMGQLIQITGKLSLLYSHFEVNFLRTNGGSPSSDETEIAFHFNPRRLAGVVVMNTRDKSSRWGREERPSADYPFSAGSQFDILMRVAETCFQVAVNGEPFSEYPHRLLPLETIDYLQITGDVDVSSVRFA